MSKKRRPEQNLDDILVDVDFEAKDDDSARDSDLGRFSDECSVFLTDTIDTAEVTHINGPAIQQISVFSAQDSADGPLNIEADFPSDTENFADFIDTANHDDANPRDRPILPNTNNGEEPPSPNTNVAAMGTGIDGILANEDGIASVPPSTLPPFPTKPISTIDNEH